MSSLEAHAILQQDTAESIPCNGDKEQWLWLEAQRTKLSQKLLLMAPTSFWLSSLSVSHLRDHCSAQGQHPGCWAGSCPSPAPHHTLEVFVTDSALGSGAGSQWQHLPLPVQLSQPELSRHVPVSPVWSDKVTQLTAAHTKHLAFSSGLLAVTLGTLCCFDWHHSNCFPSCPAFQRRLQQGERVGKEQRGGRERGLQR